ncbi:hypothetical protein [Rhodovarius crocodyli]|uniref:hypothetical protein n=1 Tax=Rhodovarius crocodyli TaxID=1979269 RepID=UPI001F0C8456|nr:hypothetical protein [Rhodovarius crocodyli]
MADTVTIASKLPHGLRLDLMPEVDTRASGRPGETEAVQRPPVASVTLRGCALPVGVPLPEDAPTIAGGFALTPDVPADFWAKWLEQNRDYAPVKAGLIFAASKGASVAAEAREKKAVLSGFEGMNPDKPAPGIQPGKAA